MSIEQSTSPNQNPESVPMTRLSNNRANCECHSRLLMWLLGWLLLLLLLLLLPVDCLAHVFLRLHLL
jgi:hypothetical protein